MMVLGLKIKYAIVDIDGVLCEHGKNIMPESIKAMNILNKNGIKVIYASGKNSWYITGGLHFSGLLKDNTIIIGENGGEIFYPYNFKIQQYKKYLKDIKKLKKEFYKKYLCNTEYGIFFSYENYSGYVWEEPKNTIFTLFPSDIKRTPPIVLKKLFDKIIKENSLNLYSFSHIDSAEVLQKGINKACALDILRKLEIIEDQSYSICFVDNINDKELAKWVHYPIAVSNAKEEIKEIVRKKGGYISKKPYGHGVLEAIKYLFGE